MAQKFPPLSFVIGPYNPWTGAGDEDDSVQYIQPPGLAFLRPWLQVPGGRSFVWPLGVEGFSLSIEPQLGIHHFIGDNAVKVDVMHKGEERVTLNGSFPGDTSTDAFQALREAVYADTPVLGKVLYVPHVFTYTQRVVIANARFDHAEDDFSKDLNYSIDFVRTGLTNKVAEPSLQQPIAQGRSAPKGGSSRKFTVNSKYNTLRKIAALKLKNANRWDDIYKKNTKLFTKLKVSAHKAPDYHLKVGTGIYW